MWYKLWDGLTFPLCVCFVGRGGRALFAPFQFPLFFGDCCEDRRAASVPHFRWPVVHASYAAQKINHLKVVIKQGQKFNDKTNPFPIARILKQANDSPRYNLWKLANGTTTSDNLLNLSEHCWQGLKRMKMG